MESIDKIFYAMKANSNIEVLHCIYNNGFGFECVSIEEIYYIKKETHWDVILHYFR